MDVISGESLFIHLRGPLMRLAILPICMQYSPLLIHSTLMCFLGIEIGSRVRLKKRNICGTVRHAGSVHFSVGDYLGIELGEESMLVFVFATAV